MPSPAVRGSAGQGRPARLARWIFTALSLVVLASTLRHAELGRAAHMIGEIGAPVALVALPWAVAMSLHALGYARLLHALGRTASFPRLLSVVVSTEAVLMAVPAGGAIADGLNPYLLDRRCGVPLPEGLAVVAARKALVVLTNGLYMGIAAAAGASWLRAASPALIGAPGLLWLVVATTFVLLAVAVGASRVLVSGTLASRSHGVLSRIPIAPLRRWLARAERGFTETDRHFASVFGAGSLAAPTGIFLAAWLAEGTEAWLVLRLLGVDLPFAEVLAFETVVSLVRSLVFVVPAGLGVQEAGYVAFFAAFGIPDAPTLGVAFALVKRARELLWIGAGLALFPLMGDRAVWRGAESPASTRPG